ncbi:conserved hypothetical protein [Leishmania major strain Friedlin]|uniref:Uncharacterized protein n=1 Tax=Leishmania major TaxID=5664 RepID=Q4Q5D9_LEIMA|nr:conserved hypothetical protein [Leishmania major strain Friedlin]CAG9580217.1 hypothetical_protein_-_conserved [Leishmania major strain Friedlin]CAJ08663.1 conserved hypothetical protein [Leishmania major strain Friedlin]|eukprot:XP_001685459.1 conserved hypothetical protein [Leishmania major strain Friedlin]
MKIMGQPPPGAKIIVGPPPPGAKAMLGAPPPGFKIMHSSPPPGTMHVASPPLSSTPPSLSHDNTPPLPPGMAAKTPMKMLPPGAKLISGQPPLGSRPVSPEEARHSATSPSLIPSRSVSPTNATVFRILPNGVKVLVSPPTVGGPVHPVSKALPGHLSPPLPAKSPPNTLIKSMRDSNLGGAPTAPASRTTAPLIPPQNVNVSVGPKLFPGPQQQLPKPTPVRPGGSIVKAVEAPHRTPPGRKQQTSAAKEHQSDVQVKMHKSESDEFTFQEEDNLDNSTDIQFEEAPSVMPSDSPRAGAAVAELRRISSSGSSSSSLSLRKDPDEATALPTVMKPHSSTAPTVIASPSSPLSAVGTVAPVEYEKSLHRHRSQDGASKGARKKKRKGRHASPRDDRLDDGKSSRKQRRNHHYHRSHSSDVGNISRSSASLQSYSAPGAPVSASPAAVDDKQRRTPPQRAAASGKDDVVDTPGELGGEQLRELAFTPEALTSASRDRIAEDFLSILCPQQYYGKVQKISRIRAFKADRSAATGLRSSTSIYVATKGVMPNPYFYPQLRLRNSDGEKLGSLARADEVAEGVVNTPIILYEATPGNMLFAGTELEARRLLESNRNFNSCFMLSNSAILFRAPEQYVVPIASLNVQWVPYTSPQSEPQCPVHRRELQLFDPCSKELVCALCASRNCIPMSNFVVIPDVLGNLDSRRTVEEKVSVQLDEAQQSAKRWVEQHQRVRELCESKKDAIRNQFNLLINALEAKKKEYIEACEAEFAYAQTDVAREILITDEKVQLLRAATDHLRTDPSKPLFSMQIATIAEGLSASTDLPSRFTRASLRLPPMSAGLMPNLEGVMSQVLELSPQLSPSGARGGEYCTEDLSLSNAPYKRPNWKLSNDGRSVEEAVNIVHRDRWRLSGTRAAAAAASPAKSPRPASRNADASPLLNNGRSACSSSPARPALSGPVATREYVRSMSGSSQKRSLAGSASSVQFAADAVSVPNSTGTSLFDFALHHLLSTLSASNVKRWSPRYVQWAIRIDDPGDWVGLGVGVGNTIEAWEQGSTNDLSHLWIVPASMTGQVLYLRVAVSSSSGHAKLTVHDVRGKQVDGGEVPQWNAARPSYPQATFGGGIGSVRMIEIPHVVH